MYHSGSRRPRRGQRVAVVDVVLIVLVLVAVAALIGYVIAEAGGGHMLT